MQATMKEPVLKYRGYHGTCEPQEDGTLYGRIAFIRDQVTFEAKSLDRFRTEFIESVDGYLADCAALGKTPDAPERNR